MKIMCLRTHLCCHWIAFSWAIASIFRQYAIKMDITWSYPLQGRSCYVFPRRQCTNTKRSHLAIGKWPSYNRTSSGTGPNTWALSMLLSSNSTTSSYRRCRTFISATSIYTSSDIVRNRTQQTPPTKITNTQWEATWWFKTHQLLTHPTKNICIRYPFSKYSRIMKNSH